MGFALIFCYGYWCICRFVVVVGMGSLWVYSGDGFTAVEVATVWVRFRWHLGGDWVAFWVAQCG